MSALQSRYVCRQCLRRIICSRARSNSTVSFRKELKDEVKRRRLNRDGSAWRTKRSEGDRTDKNWELTVGIEIHAQLNTPHKLFSKATTSFNDLPNSHVALFDAAFPGTQPVFQKEALIPALRAAIALGCDIPRASAFDRKHYFYWDQPSGYQITQYYHPLAKDGFITLYNHDGIAPEDGKEIRVGIKQIQMEQDTAKTLHQPPSTHLLDFNRVSHPLIEIITLPHIHHPATAAACVRKIQAILNAVDAAVLGMELGGLRADVNVSVRRKDQPEGHGFGAEYYGIKGLGQRTEIKNLSSFKAVEDAIKAERDRQIRVLETGGTIEGETRGWTLGSTETRKLRGKEGEIDYRYMPDPDLGPVVIGKDLVEHIKLSLPSLPDEELQILTSPTSDFSLTVKDAKTLMTFDNGKRVEYYKDVVAIVRERLMGPEKYGERGEGYTDTDEVVAKVGRISGNWVLHELGGLLTTSETPWNDNPVAESSLADILTYLSRKRITGTTAKSLLALKFQGDSRPVSQIILDESLFLRPMSRDELYDLAHEVLKGNEKMIEQIKKRKQTGKIHYFVGQMIRRGGGGRVEAGEAERALRDVLSIGE